MKLEALAKTPGDAFEMPMPPHGERKRVPSVVSAMAQVISWRCEQLGAFKHEGPTPVKDALFSAKEPKTGTDGTLSWTVDINNPSTGEDFVLGLKEITLPDGVTRPYSMWLSGNYPRALDGLSKLLSLDMRVLDPAWIGMKLRKLIDYSEPLGDFMAFVPGSRKQQTYPSTVAYIANLIIHRYAMLGILDESGFPLQQMGILEAPENNTSNKVLPTQGKLCGECGNHTMIRKDGCDFCTHQTQCMRRDAPLRNLALLQIDIQYQNPPTKKGGPCPPLLKRSILPFERSKYSNRQFEVQVQTSCRRRFDFSFSRSTYPGDAD
jgi:ribonucleoside-diphosphate reductase alpha chain